MVDYEDAALIVTLGFGIICSIFLEPPLIYIAYIPWLFAAIWAIVGIIAKLIELGK